MIVTEPRDGNNRGIVHGTMEISREIFFGEGRYVQHDSLQLRTCQ